MFENYKDWTISSEASTYRCESKYEERSETIPYGSKTNLVNLFEK